MPSERLGVFCSLLLPKIIEERHFKILAEKMSRAHMLYDNKPLESVAVTVRKWKSKWNPDEIFRFQE